MVHFFCKKKTYRLSCMHSLVCISRAQFLKHAAVSVFRIIATHITLCACIFYFGNFRHKCKFQTHQLYSHWTCWKICTNTEHFFNIFFLFVTVSSDACSPACRKRFMPRLHAGLCFVASGSRMNRCVGRWSMRSMCFRHHVVDPAACSLPTDILRADLYRMAIDLSSFLTWYKTITAEHTWYEQA